MTDLLQQIKDWSMRTRSDLAPVQEQLEHPDQLFAAKALITEVLRNFDELDKLVAGTKGNDLVLHDNQSVSDDVKNPPKHTEGSKDGTSNGI